MSNTARPWKNIHQAYHSLSVELQGVVQILSEYRNGYQQDRDVEDISASDLRNKFSNGILGNAVWGFGNNTRASINTINHFHDKSKEVSAEELAKVRDSGRTEIAESLENIISAQENVLRTHKQFISFLTKIQTFRDNDSWGAEQKEYILSQKGLLKDGLPAIIFDTDVVLM